MKKRAIRDGYEFTSKPLYPKWQIRVRDLCGDLTVDLEPGLWVRVDHRFQTAEGWKQLQSMIHLASTERRIVAFMIQMLKGDIFAIKEDL